YRSEAVKEKSGSSVAQSDKRSCTPICWHGSKRRLPLQKIAKQFAICFQNPASSFTKQIEMLKCNDAEQFTRINRRRAIEIVQAAHLPGQIRTCQNPFTSQAADAVNFRQTARYNEFRSEVE